MKISELKRLIRQLLAIVVTVALLATLVPDGIKVAKAEGVLTAESARFDFIDDPGSYTFYRDFNPNDYVATGSRITVTYCDEDEIESEETFVVEEPTHVTEEEYYNEEAECYETEAYSIEDDEKYILIRYYEDRNEVSACIPDEESGEDIGIEFSLYQPRYLELDQMPVVTLDTEETIRDLAYTKYYRFSDDMLGSCVDISTREIGEAVDGHDPYIELYEKQSDSQLWNWIAEGEDRNIQTGDLNDRLVYSLKTGASYVLGVSNTDDYEVLLNITLSVKKFITAETFSAKISKDDYFVYPQFGVYPYVYEVTNKNAEKETAYGTGAVVQLQDGIVNNHNNSSIYTGLDAKQLSVQIDSARLKTVSFPVQGEEYELNSSITIPAGTQKLMCMSYDTTEEDCILSITNGDDRTIVSYVNESMDAADRYGCSGGGILYQLNSYAGDTCYLLFQNYSDHEATYTITGKKGQGIGSNNTHPDNGNTGNGNTGNGGAGNAGNGNNNTGNSGTGNQGTGTDRKTVSIKGKTVTSKKIKYKATSENTAAVIGTTAAKKLKSVKIPATVKIGGVNCKVTAVNANAFKNCKKLKSVQLGKNVTKINGKAFAGCKKLTKVSLASKKVVKVAKKSFQGCKKVTFKVKKSLKKSYTKSLKKSKIGCKYVVK